MYTFVMLCRMMLCKIVCRFSFPAFHAMRKFLKGFWSQIQKYFIFVARYCCFLVVSLVIPEAVALSVYTFVMGCGWSISSNLFRKTGTSLPVTKHPPVYDSAT